MGHFGAPSWAKEPLKPFILNGFVNIHFFEDKSVRRRFRDQLGPKKAPTLPKMTPKRDPRSSPNRPKIRRPFKFASKFMSILISLFGRFGVDLGSFLGVIFGHVGAFFDPSWSRNRLRTVLSSKKMIVRETLRFLLLFGQN